MRTLRINRGTTFNITVEYLTNGVPTTLVGATLYFTMKPVEYDDDILDTTAVVQKEVTSHTDAAGGISSIVIDPVDTATLIPDTYNFDIKVKNTTLEVYKLSEGLVKLDGSPTNRSVP